MLLSKKAHEKTHVHRAKFNGRPKLPGWPGKKMALPQAWASSGFYRRGRVRKLVQVQ
jgi:hypothetical protein